MSRMPLTMDEHTRRLLEGFEPSAAQGMEPQVAKYIRGLIQAGDLAPDSTLPSTRTLACLWNINPTSIHLALAGLARQGLLTRAHGRGTVIRAPRAELSCVGLYESTDFLRPGSGDAYVRSVLLALRRRLATANCTLRIWVDPRPMAQQVREPLATLAEACRRQDIQGLVVIGASHYHLEWISRLPAPIACMGGARLPMAVGNDPAQLLVDGAAELARQGCRSAGLITPWATDDVDPDGRAHMTAEAFTPFVDACGGLGLAIRSRWMRARRRDEDSAGLAIERFGYDAFKTLWARPARPDGLIVADDVAARGVITAILERRVDVPRALKLVLHRNREIGLLCPFPASFLEASADEAAAALLETVRKQFAGETCERVSLPHRLVRA